MFEWCLKTADSLFTKLTADKADKAQLVSHTLIKTEKEFSIQ